MRIAFIDHYDSFSFNVLAWLRKAGSRDLEVTRVTCDDETGLARIKKQGLPLVLSPGPGKPSDYPRTQNLVDALLDKVPIFGVCLGHQILGVRAGGKIVRALDPWHGTWIQVHLKHAGAVTKGLPNQFSAVVYNSLVVDMTEVSDPSWVKMATDDHGQLMMLAHQSLPVSSVQFHPESFGSPELSILAKNFIDQVRSWEKSSH